MDGSCKSKPLGTAFAEEPLSEAPAMACAPEGAGNGTGACGVASQRLPNFVSSSPNPGIESGSLSAAASIAVQHLGSVQPRAASTRSLAGP